MIPFEVIVPVGSDHKPTDGIAIATELINGGIKIGIIIKGHLNWYDSDEVKWGAPYPIDVRHG